MPGPVLFGVFIDRTCELWETTCQGQGNCLVYDNEVLSYRLAAAILLFQGKEFGKLLMIVDDLQSQIESKIFLYFYLFIFHFC